MVRPTPTGPLRVGAFAKAYIPTIHEEPRRPRPHSRARLWRQSIYGTDFVSTFEDAALSYLEAGGEGRFLPPLIRYFKGTLLAGVKPGHIRDAARKLYPKGSPATQHRQGVTPAVAVINHAHDKGWCPMIRVKAKGIRRPVRRAVDRAYIEKVSARHVCRGAIPGATLRH